MPRDYRVYLDDMIEAVLKIEAYLEGINLEKFLEDSMRVDAVVRNLEIIGEAAGRIPEEIRSKYPHVEWRKINGFRNKAVHEYFSVDLETVWSIFQVDIPILKEQIRAILAIEDADSD